MILENDEIGQSGEDTGYCGGFRPGDDRDGWTGFEGDPGRSPDHGLGADGQELLGPAHPQARPRGEENAGESGGALHRSGPASGLLSLPRSGDEG